MWHKSRMGEIKNSSSNLAGSLEGKRIINTKVDFKKYDMHADRGSTVVKALCYKSEGRCFHSRWCHWNF